MALSTITIRMVGIGSLFLMPLQCPRRASYLADMPRHRPRPKADDPAEYRRFIDMAREVEADEDPSALDRAFERVVGPAKSDQTAPKEQKHASTRRRDQSR